MSMLLINMLEYFEVCYQNNANCKWKCITQKGFVKMSRKKQVTITLRYKGAISNKFAIKLNKRFKNLLPVCELRANIKYRKYRKTCVFKYKCNSYRVPNRKACISKHTTVPKFSEKKLLKIFHKFQLALHEDLLLVTGVFPGNISIWTKYVRQAWISGKHLRNQ